MILSVTQLNEYVRGLMQRDELLSQVQLRGEVSGFKRHSSGHCYFQLKDEQAVIRCAMFRTAAQTLTFTPQDGMRVVAQGQVSVYVRDGSYQLYVEKLAADGIGALYQAYLQMRDRLKTEGLFSAVHKKQLPKLPTVVGVVTSPTGAVIRDIAQVSRRRDPGVDIVLYPARVQGEGAAQEIAQGIAALDAWGGCDVIIVGRGGGSIEDLWPFNEEVVARAIFACSTPIVSAVGHETDVTIADYVADLRAPTPSAAAELCVPLRSQLLQQADQLREGLSLSMQSKLRMSRQDHELLLGRLKAQHPGNRMESLRGRWRTAAALLPLHTQSRLTAARTRLNAATAALEALGPLSVLQRGYAIVEMNGAVKPSAKGIQPGDEITVRMRDGSLNAEVKILAEEEPAWSK